MAVLDALCLPLIVQRQRENGQCSAARFSAPGVQSSTLGKFRARSD
jgi:hypothetical protein